jgi:hypothetical protein
MLDDRVLRPLTIHIADIGWGYERNVMVRRIPAGLALSYR